jgi:hypothetical protein
MDTSSHEVMYSAEEQRVFLCNLTEETLQTTADTWWTSMNVETKHNIIWKSSAHSPAWRFFKPCVNEKNGIPGITCIVCYVILAHSSEYGINSIGNHLATKMHKAELNKLTKSDVTLLTGSAVDEQPLVVLKKKGSEGVMVAS